MTDSTEVETQPTGVSIERTLDVVAKILDDVDFANEVISHNGWPVSMEPHTVALLFLACRFQWAVDLLGRQAATLKREVDGLTSSIRTLEDRACDGK
jgi:hypothetical protein